MEVKPGYKHTEVGVLPEEWCSGVVGDVVEALEAGVSVNSTDDPPNHGAPSVLKTSAVSAGRFLPEECKCITPADVPRARLNPRANTILISRMNTPDLVGDVAYVQTDYPWLFLPDRLWMTRFRPDALLNSRWLAYLLNSRSYQQRIKAAATGTSGSMKNISKDALLGIPVVFPEPEEQTAIAIALSDVDALLTQLDRIISKKRDLKQAAMQQLLTGKTRLPGFSGEWKKITFGEITRPRSARVDPRRVGSQDFCVELEHLEAKTGRLLGCNVAGGQASLKTVFEAGDVLFGKLRAYLQKYWLADRPGVCSTEIWALEPLGEHVLPEYLVQIVRTDDFIEVASNAYGTHMPRSDWNLVKGFELDLPSTKEQTAIATALSDMDAELVTLEAHRDKMRALKQGMMQELLTGKTRLV